MIIVKLVSKVNTWNSRHVTEMVPLLLVENRSLNLNRTQFNAFPCPQFYIVMPIVQKLTAIDETLTLMVGKISVFNAGATPCRD